MEMLIKTAILILVLSMGVVNASDFTEFRVVSKSGKFKVPAAELLKMLKGDKTCVKHKSKVVWKSKNLSDEVCKDNDEVERRGLTVIRCRNIVENNIARKCKGVK